MKIIKKICMLSTHGYFDSIPQLGRTDTGGQVVYVLQLAKALSLLNTNVDIYTRWFEKSKKQIEQVPGYPNVRIIRIPAGNWEFILKEKIYGILAELAQNMIDFIQRKNLNYDLFHAHYVDAGIVGIKVAAFFKKPLFFTAHSIGAWKKEQMGGNANEMEKKYNFQHRIAEELRIFKTARANTVTSLVQEEKLENLYKFKSEKTTVIECGTDVHNFKPADANEKKIKTNLPDNYIFCLSRIDTNKGHDLLLEAFNLVKDEIADISLVIGGGSPKPQKREKEIFAQMRKTISVHKMDNRVQILGYIPDELLVPYYQQARIFVLPSLFEPFGMTTTEAMACGTPVVASKFGGIRDVISSAKNGILINPENTKEFASAMINLLKNPEDAKKIGFEGANLVKTKYSWEAIAERHIKFHENNMI
ncbi:MAG: glycosyltransferase [Armatimonadetes bacterium]|nr:glycosyltransferase [Armatimonadota bacterium]